MTRVFSSHITVGQFGTAVNQDWWIVRMTENQIFARWGLIDVSDFLLEHKFPQTLLEGKKKLGQIHSWKV